MARFQDSIETVITARDESAAELRRAEAARRELAERERGRSREQENNARNIARVQGEIRQASLRAEGRDLEANLIRVRAGFAERIRAARAANNAELANRLRTLSAIREAEQRDAAARAAEARRSSRLQDGANRFTGRLGQVAIVAAAAELGSGVIDTAAAAFRGDFEAAAERLKQIPAFGSVVRFADSALGTFTGVRAEISRINELEKERTAEIRRRQTLIDANRTFEARVDTLRDQVALINAATESERDALRTARRREQVEQELSRLAAARGGIGRAIAEQEVKSLTAAIAAQELEDRVERFEARRASLRRDRQDVEAEITDLQLRGVGQVLEAELAASSQTFAARIRAARDNSDGVTATRLEALAELRAQQIRDDAAEANARALADRERASAATEAQITDIQLRRRGLVLDADLAANQRVFDERIRLAKEADNAQLASTLARLRDEKAADIRANAARREGIEGLQERVERLRGRQQAPADVTLNSDRFLTGVREQTATEDRAALDGVARQIAAAEQQIELLKNLPTAQQINTALAGATPVVVGLF